MNKRRKKPLTPIQAILNAQTLAKDKKKELIDQFICANPDEKSNRCNQLKASKPLKRNLLLYKELCDLHSINSTESVSKKRKKRPPSLTEEPKTKKHKTNKEAFEPLKQFTDMEQDHLDMPPAHDEADKETTAKNIVFTSQSTPPLLPLFSIFSPRTPAYSLSPPPHSTEDNNDAMDIVFPGPTT